MSPMWFLADGMILLFIGLKLTGHLDWAWWWVVSPIWIAFVLTVLVAIDDAIRKTRA